MSSKAFRLVFLIVFVLTVVPLVFIFTPSNSRNHLNIRQNEQSVTVYLAEGAVKDTKVLVIVSWNGTPIRFVTDTISPGDLEANDIIVPREDCQLNREGGEKFCQVYPEDDYLVEVFLCDDVVASGYRCDVSDPLRGVHLGFVDGIWIEYPSEVDVIGFNEEHYPVGVEPILREEMHFDYYYYR